MLKCVRISTHVPQCSGCYTSLLVKIARTDTAASGQNSGEAQSKQFCRNVS